ncbi:MAG TPA: hypothetical protein QGF27_05910 [Arenicellales bacterium]|jgi:hypothetical protein|nr:hypothetical protein [Nitrospinota bacterium]MBP10073.1 hypothetical protein [Acidiferrobacteraceae bacterium]MDP7218247.1 hypothetical protein [Arenicellales bacterium]HJP09537.1 hypothetical protein [Arenicellales bacterium]|tara:strand:+ start:16906 stop:17631 length:726 start_codon:yes stop_codon:yes gene_type:complete
MKLLRMTVVSLVALVLPVHSGVDAKEKEHKHEMAQGEHKHETTKGEHKHEMSHAKKIACTAPVHITEENELKPGGALYRGPLPKEAQEVIQRDLGGTRTVSHEHSKSAKQMKEMEGAHSIHQGLRGGELFMVPNQLHHIEVVYSLECGYQLFFYNAFTEPIRADRFHAFMLILPEGGDGFFEVLRFLVPNEDGSHLVSHITPTRDGVKPKGIFETELYVKFPERVQPILFEVIVGTEVEWN